MVPQVVSQPMKQQAQDLPKRTLCPPPQLLASLLVPGDLQQPPIRTMVSCITCDLPVFATRFSQGGSLQSSVLPILPNSLLQKWACWPSIRQHEGSLHSCKWRMKSSFSKQWISNSSIAFWQRWNAWWTKKKKMYDKTTSSSSSSSSLINLLD